MNEIPKDSESFEEFTRIAVDKLKSFLKTKPGLGLEFLLTKFFNARTQHRRRQTAGRLLDELSDYLKNLALAELENEETQRIVHDHFRKVLE